MQHIASRDADGPHSPRLTSLLPFALAFAYLAAALHYAPAADVLPPDGLHNAILARNLARGDGYVVHLIQYHAGAFESVTHVPEMHGIAQPLLLGGLFATLGPDVSLVPVPGLVFVALTGVVTFFFARRLFGVPAALLACILVLCNCHFTLASWSGTDDAGFAFLSLAAIALLERALRDRTGAIFLGAGLAGAAAMLQKATGIVLVPVFLIPLVLRRETVRTRVQWTLLLIVPVLLGLCIYLWRNWVGHGGLAFRWGAIDWLFKSQGITAFQAVYESPPALWPTLRSLGFGEVVDIMRLQLATFLNAAFRVTPLVGCRPDALTAPGFVFGIGALSLLVHLRHNARFALLALVSGVVTVGLVCCVWHLDIRFLIPLVPLTSISFAGALALAGGSGSVRWERAIRAVALAAGLTTAGLALAGLCGDLASAADRPARDHQCADAQVWIERNTSPSDHLLTLDPWFWTWATDRPSIVVPSGGRSAIQDVARRYEASWLVVEPRFTRVATMGVLRRIVRKPGPLLPGELAFDGEHCDVFRLRPRP